MSEKESTDKSTWLNSFVRHRRKLAIAAGLVVVYALCGFFLAPWLLRMNAIDIVQQRYGAELRLERVAINPFVLSLTIEGVALDAPDGSTVASVRTLFVNFQSSSLFRRAWTFDEVRIDAPAVVLDRAPSGLLNVAFLAGAPAEAAEPAADAPGGLPRILIFDFAVNESSAEWTDRMPSTPVRSQFGPVNVRIEELNTLPSRAGVQSVEIRTENGSTLTWSGDLQLNPLRSSGAAAIEGPHFSLPSRYLRQATGFSIPDGLSRITLNYTVSVDDRGALRASVEDLELDVTDVRVRRSDPGTPLDGEQVRDILALPAFRVTGASVEWPERRVTVPSVLVEDAAVRVYRDEGGRINWLPERTDSEEVDTAPPAAGPPWNVHVERVDVRRLSIDLEDHAVDPYAEIGLASVDLVLTDIVNRDGAEMPLSGSIETRGGGTIRVDGSLVALPEPMVDWTVAAEGLVLAFGHPYLKPLADVNLDSGTLDAQVTVRSDASEPLDLSGGFQVHDFLVTETDTGSRLGSWDALDVGGLEFGLAGKTLAIDTIAFRRAYADILVAADGTVNLGRVERGSQLPPSEDAAPPVATADAPASDDGPLRVRVGRVTFENSGADFADESLPLPFAARIAELKGEISTIASNSREPSNIALEGRVDEHGFVRVSGSVTPLDPSLDTDVSVKFENVDMPKFSAYTVPFAGREIASGRLDLELGYVVVDSRLNGDNRIVLRDFELGDKVEHPGAMSLPLGLAVALLKDPDGVIDIELPVKGDVSDPEFSYGGVVLGALANLIVKIVASPFALLGNLLGVEADELSHVEFIAGRSDLTPPQRETAKRLAEALSLRPELVLELPGAIDRDVDGAALRAAAVDRQVAAITEGQDDGGDTLEQEIEALERLFGELPGNADAEAALDTLRTAYTTPAGDDPDAPAFDAVAYAAALRRRLADEQVIAEQEFAALAASRAAAVRDAVVTADPTVGARVVAGRQVAVSGSDGDRVAMEVSLTTGGEAPDESPATGSGEPG